MSRAQLIPVTRGLFVLVDCADVESVLERSWCATPTSSKRANHYAQSRDGDRQIRLHRFLMQPEDHQEVDHIDGDGLNCTRQNLRVCSRQENARNVIGQHPAALSVGLLPPSVIGYRGDFMREIMFPPRRDVRAQPGKTYILGEATQAGAPLEWSLNRWGYPVIPGLEAAVIAEERAEWLNELRKVNDLRCERGQPPLAANGEDHRWSQ